MSLLFSVVFATRCRSTHHRLALDALRFLKGPDADGWRALLLHHHDQYLKGAKAPDDVFKDFKNHVLHVRHGEWGGAIEAAEEWKKRTLRAMKDKDWPHVAWCAGVMSHYVVDPCQPFHTHQTEEEDVIHRAVEWSFNKSYAIFQGIIERDLGGYPAFDLPGGEGWLGETIRQNARLANQSYETVIDHYNFAVGVKRPIDGLDQELRSAIAPLVARATISWARIFDRVAAEAQVKPPKVDGGLQAFFLALEAPIQIILKSIGDSKERAYVAAQYEEFRRTGKVRKTLSDDDGVVRALHAQEVLNVQISSLDARWPREIGTLYKPAKVKRGKKRKSAPPNTKVEAPLPATPAPEAPPAAEPPRVQAQSQPAPASFTPAPQPPAPQPPVEAEPPKPAAAKALEADPPPRSRKSAPAPDPEPQAEEPATPPLLLTKKVVEKKKKGAASAEDPSLRFSLTGGAPIVDAPSIGPKTAKRFHAIGIHTVSDFLALSPATTAVLLKTKHISAIDIADWQSEAMLACTIPDLKSREAQALVACGMRDIEALSQADAGALGEGMRVWAASREGARAWGNAAQPADADAQSLIDRAKVAWANRPKTAA